MIILRMSSALEFSKLVYQPGSCPGRCRPHRRSGCSGKALCGEHTRTSFPRTRRRCWHGWRQRWSQPCVSGGLCFKVQALHSPFASPNPRAPASRRRPHHTHPPCDHRPRAHLEPPHHTTRIAWSSAKRWRADERACGSSSVCPLPKASSRACTRSPARTYWRAHRKPHTSAAAPGAAGWGMCFQVGSGRRGGVLATGCPPRATRAAILARGGGGCTTFRGLRLCVLRKAVAQRHNRRPDLCFLFKTLNNKSGGEGLASPCRCHVDACRRGGVRPPPGRWHWPPCGGVVGRVGGEPPAHPRSASLVSTTCHLARAPCSVPPHNRFSQTDRRRASPPQTRRLHTLHPLRSTWGFAL